MRALVVACVVGLLCAGAAMAQGEPAATTVPLDRFRAPIDDRGLGTTEGGGIAGHLGMQGGLVLNHAVNPLVVRDERGAIVAPIVAHRLAGDLLFTIGLFDVVSLGVDVPLMLLQLGGDVPANLQEAVGVASGLSAIGVGDVRLVPKVRLLREDRHGVSLALIPTVTLPTAGGLRFGDEVSFAYGADYLGEGPGAVAFIPEVALSTTIGGLRPAVNLAYRLRQPTRLFDTFPIDPEFVYRVGVGYDVATVAPALSSLLFFGEVFGATSDRNPFGLVDGSDQTLVRLQNPLEVLVGARWRTPAGVALEGGVGTGLRPGFGTPDVRAFLGVRLAIENRDRDGDGIDDDDDACPDDAEDRDGVQDGDGCPDPDNDGDGIPDGSDRCPDRPEDIDGFEDDDGCADDDNDGDGITDASDACPDVAGRPEWQGCPPPDSDGDGLTDDVDACKDTPGLREKNGCPEKDRDQDGVRDADDRCPDQPGPKATDGCPDGDGDGLIDSVDRCPTQAGPASLKGCADSDSDGIADPDDQCPGEPETINGVKDDDGCPDEGKVLVVVTKEKIELKETVFFDSGKATIQKRSFPLLDQIGLVLKAHPEVKKVRIEGHTDSDGNDSKNLDLSKRRARAVLDALVARGVEASRLESEGYGETRPIADNTTKDGKAQNRRVELAILEQ
jgi:outer membrane protein OmpA-like peptidoglycan-associated protein